MSRPILLLLNIISTTWITATMWFVQVIHYPIFKFINTDSFGEFTRMHMNLSILLLSIPIFIELVTTLLLIKKPTPGSPKIIFKIAFVLLCIGLISTFLIQTPNLSILKRGYHDVAHTTLIWTNWIRTITWSLNNILLTVALILYFNIQKKTSPQ